MVKDSIIDFERDVYCVLGLPFDAVTLEAASEQLSQAARSGEPCLLSTPNVNFLMLSRKRPEFRDAILKSDLAVADGMPIVWLARLAGIPLPERVSGAGLFERLSSRRREGGLRVFFFGGPPGAGRRARERMNARVGGLECVGYIAPGFDSVEALSTAESIDEINRSNADFLVVALGAEKGHAWIDRNRARLEVPVMSHLGAVINFSAGTLRRAPRWVQGIGLEWLWRIKEEPSLWRRYLDDAATLTRLLLTRHLGYVVRHRLSARARRADEATVHLTEADGVMVLRLEGRWGGHNIERLRPPLSAAAASGQPIRVDLDEVGALDSRAIGLLLLLRGHCLSSGQPLEFTARGRMAERALRACCAEFLLDPLGPSVDSGARTPAAAPSGATLLKASVAWKGQEVI